MRNSGRYFYFLSVGVRGLAGRGQGQLSRAAGGLLGVAADGGRERTAHNIAMIQQGRMRPTNRRHHQPRNMPELRLPALSPWSPHLGR